MTILLDPNFNTVHQLALFIRENPEQSIDAKKAERGRDIKTAIDNYNKAQSRKKKRISYLVYD